MRIKLSYIITGVLIIIAPGVNSQNRPGHNIVKGMALFEMQLYDSAVHYLLQAGKEMDTFPEAYIIYGRALMAQDQNQLAIQEFLNAEKSKVGLGSFWLAKAWARSGDAEKTIEYLNINFNSKYREPESKILLDQDFQIFESHSKWKDFWRNSVRYTTLETILFEADYQLKSGNYTDALVLVDDGLKRGLMKGPLHSKRADIYLAMNNHRMAASDLGTAIKADRRNPDLYRKRAFAYMKLERFKQALADYDQAIHFSPLDFDLYRERADAQNNTGNYELAVEDISFYLSYFPKDHEAWYQAGLIHYTNGKYLNSLQSFNKALELNRNEAKYFAARGETYMQTKTYRYAWNDFSMALDLNPVNPKVYLSKGIAAVNLGNFKDACYSFQMARRQGAFEAEEFIGKYCSEIIQGKEAQ